MIEILLKSILFKGYSNAELLKLLNSYQFNTKEYSKNQLIAQRSTPCDYLSVVIKGIISGQMQDMSGKIVKIDELRPGMPIAPAFIFGDRNVYPVDLFSLTDCKLILFDKKTVISIIKNEEKFLENDLVKQLRKL